MNATKLRKVEDHEKTKNQVKTAGSSLVTATAGGDGSAKFNPAGRAGAKKIGDPRGPADKREERGNWYIENYEKAPSMVSLGENEANMRQVVYISSSNNSTFKVDGKVKNITVDSCNKIVLIVNDVLSGIELVNCQRCTLQILGTAQSIQIDKTDGCQIYFNNPESLDTCAITSSKSSEMNVNTPLNAEGDYEEKPIPEQFVTKFNAKTRKWVTTVSDLYS